MQCVTGDYSYDPIFPDQDPDVLLVPDYATVKPVPWASVPRAMAIHDCVELTGERCQFAPRTMLQGRDGALRDAAACVRWSRPRSSST